VVLVALQVVEAPMMRVARWVDAYVPDPELSPNPVIAIVARPDLRADVHDRSSTRLGICYILFFVTCGRPYGGRNL